MLMEKKFVEITRVPGLLNADMLKIFLESKGIEVMISQESAGKTFGLMIDGMGHARVYVPEDQVQETEEILAALDRGEFELNDEEAAQGDEKRDGK